MNDDLEEKTDAELNELFAVEVCGNEPCGYLIDGAGLRIHAHPFTTDANAVLPWLDKVKPGWWTITRTHSGSDLVVFFGTQEFGRAPTFARAAVVALLRAKRATP